MKIMKATYIALPLLFAFTSCTLLDTVIGGNQKSTPRIPTNLHATVGNAQVTLDWSVASGATEYNIYYKIGPTVSIGDYDRRIPSIHETQYVVQPLSNDGTYSFVVTASNANGESVESAMVTAKPRDPITRFTVWTNLDPAQQIPDWWTAIVAQFTAANPTIQLNVSHKGPDSTYKAALNAAATSQSLPDIFMSLDDSWYIGNPIGHAPLAKDLTPYLIVEDPQKNQFLSPVYKDKIGPSNQLYQLDAEITSSHIMYSNDRLRATVGLPAAFPATLAELLAEGQTIAAYNASNGTHYIPIAMTNSGSWEIETCLLSTLVDRTAGEAWFWNAMRGLGHFTDQVFIDAINCVSILNSSGMFDSTLLTASYFAPQAQFASGNAVYLIDGDWALGSLTTNNLTSPLSESDISIHAFPDISANPPTGAASGSTTYISGPGFSINASLSQNKADLAWKWIWYYAGPIGASIRFANFDPQVSYKVDQTKLSVDALLSKMMEFKKNVPEFSPVIYNSVNNSSGTDLRNGISLMLQGTKTPTQVASDFEVSIEANEPIRHANK